MVPSAPIPILNTTGETIPPGAAVEPVGTADSSGRLRVRKPTIDDSYAVLINGSTPIPAGGAGAGYLAWYGPLAAAVDATLIDADTGDWLTPQLVLGTRAGSWRLHADQIGFLVQADPLGGLVPVQAAPGFLPSESGSGGSGSGSSSASGRLIGTVVSRVACVEGVLTVYVRDQYQDAALRVTDGAERYGYTAGCCECGGSGSGSGSGSSGSSGSGGGTVSSTCCPPTMLTAYTLTVSGGGGSFPITWNPSASEWQTGLITVVGCGTMAISMVCGGSGASGLTLTNTAGVSPQCSPAFNALTYSRTCSPFSVSVDGVSTGVGGCTGCTKTFTVS